MVTLFDHGDIDIDNIALFQYFFVTWDAVANDMINRGADRFRKAFLI